MQLFDSVVLIQDLPEFKLHAGDVGAIVEIFEKPPGLMVEFNSMDGDLVALPIVQETQLRSLRDDDMYSVRTVTQWKWSDRGSEQDIDEREASPVS